LPDPPRHYAAEAATAVYGDSPASLSSTISSRHRHIVRTCGRNYKHALVKINPYAFGISIFRHLDVATLRREQ
jgi:hypothetical protein